MSPRTSVNLNGKTKLSGAGQDRVASFGFTILLFALIVAPFVAKADVGIIRSKQNQGAFVITIFTSPEASVGVPTDVTIMVQHRDTGEAVLDAVVDLRFVPPSGPAVTPNDPLCGRSNNPLVRGLMVASAQPSSLRATRSQAANKLLYGAPVVFPVAGTWQLGVLVQAANEKARVACALPIGVPPRRLQGLWPYLALPPFVIALFAMNQWLRRRPAQPSLRAKRASGSHGRAGAENKETPCGLTSQTLATNPATDNQYHQRI
jgi:hypothetical protein